MLKRKEEEILEFKKTTENGYVKITPVKNDWNEFILFYFDENNDVSLPTFNVLLDDGEGEIEIKRAFYRTYFEKRGASYSCVASDYYVPTVKIPVKVKINDLGKQVSIKKPTGNIISKYIDEVIDAKDFISEEKWNSLNEDDKLYLRSVNTASLREDLLEFLNTRKETPYNLALFELSQKYDLFKQIHEPEYEEVFIDQWEDADIDVSVGDKTFKITKYALQCKGFWGFSITINIKDLILNAVKKDGFKEV